MKIAILCLVLAAAVAALLVLWRKRVRARRRLEAMAMNIGFNRLPAETDEELRARIRSTLTRGPTSFGRLDVRAFVAETFWIHGYPRIEIEFSEPDFGLIRAHAKAKVPAAVLRAVEDDLRERMPVFVALELTADT